jgi:protein ImuB
MNRILCARLPWGVRCSTAKTNQQAPSDPLEEWLALEELARACQTFSPIVGLDETDPLGTLLLDITGLEDLFGGETGLVRAVHAEFARRKIPVQLAVADTLGVAWAIAHHTSHREGGSPVIVPVGSGHKGIESLPITALRLSLPTLSLLAELGIVRVGQVMALPRDGLRSRFGPELLLRLDQAQGLVPEVILPPPRLPEWQCERRYIDPLMRHDMIEQELSSLLEELAAKLQAAQVGALALACDLLSPLQKKTTLAVHFFRATAAADRWWELVRLQLEKVSRQREVDGIEIRVETTSRLTATQQELFPDERTQEDQAAVATLLERLSGRLGRTAVLRAELLHEAQPDWAYRYHAWIGGILSPRAGRVPPPRGERPLCLLTKPVRLAVRTGPSSMPPTRFEYQEEEHEVASCTGPERIETGWWRGGMSRRDYFIVQTTRHDRWWLFRERPTGTWYLHGAFV